MSRRALALDALRWTESLLAEIARRGEARLKDEGSIPSPIRELHLELTRRCDMRCLMCHHWRRHRAEPAATGRELGAAELEHILGEARTLDGVETIVLTGGEPCLRQDLPEIAALLCRRFPKASLGVLSHFGDPTLLRRRLTQLRAAGVQRLWLGSSLDGVGGAHDLIRGRSGAFAGLVESMGMLRREFPDITFSFNLTITPHNYRQLWPAYRFATEQGVWFGAQMAVNHTGVPEAPAFLWKPAQIAAITGQIDLVMDDICRREGILPRLLQGRESESVGLLSRILYWHYLKEYIRTPRRFFPDCLAGQRYAMLDPEGSLFFCPVNKQRTVGSVREAPFDEVWQSPRARQERDNVARGRCHCWLLCTANPVLDRIVALGCKKDTPLRVASDDSAVAAPTPKKRTAQVALVQCPGWGQECPPFSLAALAAYARQNGHEAACFDLNNELYHAAAGQRAVWDDKDLYSFWENPALVGRLMESQDSAVNSCVNRILASGAKVIGFTTHTTSVLASLEIAGRIKHADPSRLVVFGGPRCAREQRGQDLALDPRVDAVAVGEGEETLRELLDQLRAGKSILGLPGLVARGPSGIVDGGDRAPIMDLDRLPFPDYSDFTAQMREGRYRNPRRLEIMDSRGCARSCHFCSEWQFWTRFRSMSGERIFAEISHQMQLYPQVNHFYFIGSLLNGRLRELERFCDLVIAQGLPVTWEGQAIVVPGMDERLLAKMARAGCRWLGFGIESGSPKVRAAMNKRFTNAQALRALRAAHAAGIKAQINVMFGIPGETKRDFSRTLDLLKRARPFVDSVLASQSFCVIDKNTRLYNHPKEFGITGAEHHLYWKSDGGRNDYPERFRRYEEFCRLALALGLPETSGVLRSKPDKWLLLGAYYEREADLPRAILCYRRSWRLESQDETLREALRRCYDKAGRPARGPAFPPAPQEFSPRGFNMVLNQRETAAGEQRLRSTPVLVTLGAHQACNARCIFCPEGDYPRFTLETYRDFFEVRMGSFLRNAQKITFTGFGELLLMPKAEAFLDYINRSLPETEKILTTNGTPLRPSVVERLLQGRYAVQVSLHSSRAGLHQELTGLKGRFQEIIDNLRSLSKWRDRSQASGRLHLELVNVLNSRNIADLPDFIRLAWDLGAQSVRGLHVEVFTPKQLPLSCFFHQGQANAALQTAARTADQLRQRAPDRPFRVDLPPLFGGGAAAQSLCTEPWQHIYVELQGSVLPCCRWGEHIGNIKDSEIGAIWNSPFYRSLRCSMAQGKPHPWCRRCARYAGYNVDDLSCHITNRPQARAAILAAARKLAVEA